VRSRGRRTPALTSRYRLITGWHKQTVFISTRSIFLTKLTRHTGRMKRFGEPRRHPSDNPIVLIGAQWEGTISCVNACCMSLRCGAGMLSFVSVLSCTTYVYFSLFSVRKTSSLLLSASVLWIGNISNKDPQRLEITIRVGGSRADNNRAGRWQRGSRWISHLE
jgi:hypothetical protein